MFDFGDELTIQSYKVPWLIWIQVLVMFLLIVLLCCFSIIALDPSDNSRSIASPSSSHLVSIDSELDKRNINTTLVANRLQSTQVREQSIKGEISEGTTRRAVRGGEDTAEREDSTAGNHLYFHPCYYMRLARIAFLSCLGLDSTSDSSSTPQRRKIKKEQ